MYDLGVFIGRFQPFHNGHMEVALWALARVQNLLILCGSSGEARSLKNPFIFSERAYFIDKTLEDFSNRLHCAPLKDYPGNDALWKECVLNKVEEYAVSHKKKRIALIGHYKDDSSFYLNLFPEWEMLWVENFAGISATPIREYYFNCPEDDLLGLPISHAVRDFLLQFRQKEDYKKLRELFLKVNS